MNLLGALIFINVIHLNFADDVYSILNQFNSNFSGIVAAYGDYNADKNIDIFAISNLGQNIDVWLADKEGSFHSKQLLQSGGLSIAGSFISGLMVTDFNQDGYLDALSLWQSTKFPSSILLRIYWGSKDAFTGFFDLEGSYSREPVLLDYNADMQADILTEDADSGELKVWLSSGNASFTSYTFPSKFSISHPHSSAFVQVLGSLNTDLVITAEEKNFLVFEDGEYSKPALNYNIVTTKQIGQSSFADLDEDMLVEHLLPVGNEIRVYSEGKWHLLANLEPDYSFDYAHGIEQEGGMKHLLPPTLLMGDYDNDGFPDVLTVVKDAIGKHTAILLKNQACDVSNECVGFGRRLKVQASVLPALPFTIHSASFFDYLEDGNLDILLLTSSSSEKLHPLILNNNIASDTCFMKVTVTSGLASWPLEDHKPYGLNCIGSTVLYETTKFGGETQVAIASQLTQQAHFSLQQPYVLFGLGQTPNFVDTVNITLPQLAHKPLRSRIWTQIIPNSQLLVNPDELSQPSTWSMRLFMMPSKQIFTTTAVLGAICILLAFVVAGLFAVEKHEDKAVRSQESQRFHFDAM